MSVVIFEGQDIRWATLIAGGLGGVLAVLYLIAARSYDLGTIAQPGPGLYPLGVGAVMLIGGVGTALGSLRGAGESIPWPRGAALFRVGLLSTALIAFVVGFEGLGYPIVAAMLCFVAMQVCAYRSLPTRAVWSIVMSIGTYYLFTEVFGVLLSTGPLRL